MTKREADILEIKELFMRCFGAGEDILSMYFAPGRINIIGEHIDYNGGFVMPCAINRGTYMAVAPNGKAALRFFSCSHQEDGVYEFSLKGRTGELPWEKTGQWVDYPLGVVEMFRQRGFHPEKGYDFLYCGDLPEGAGFSSSASIEMVTAMALRDLAKAQAGEKPEIGGADADEGDPALLHEKELALLCRQAENDFVGTQCGVMDQLAVALGKENHALLLDTETLEYEHVPMELNNIRIVVVNTGVARNLADGAYNEVRTKNETAVELLGAEEGALCKIPAAEVEQHREELEEKDVFPLVRHMLNENARTLHVKKAIEDGNLHVIGQMLKESHESLRDDLEVSCFELDVLAETANETDGVLGARMMGGGFGGCIIALVEERSVRSFKRHIMADYTRKTDMMPVFYDDLKISGGAEVIYHKTSAYPRPAMKRSSFIDLNGMWDYAITKEESFPAEYQGEIRVPFSPEAKLSGVGRQVKPDEYLHYRLQHTLDEGVASRIAEGHRLILHFGAVDQTCKVFVNGNEAGGHRGGYLPFQLDITEHVRTAKNEKGGSAGDVSSGLSDVIDIRVTVRDITDTGCESTGKQRLDAGGMFYTAQSGIWQTVWMEVVPEVHIEKVNIRPDIDNDRILVTVAAAGAVAQLMGGTAETKADSKQAEPEAADRAQENPVIAKCFISLQGEILPKHIFSSDDGEAHEYIVADVPVGRETAIAIPEPALWSPENPQLYEMRIELGTDMVYSYFAMRKISSGKDEKGAVRLMLNNKPYFVNGVLDQGYWPQGLYTAPDEAALYADIDRMKALGFNCLRKHVKIEPHIWYHHCDKAGMLVMQDMVNGGGRINSLLVTYLPNIIPNFTRTLKDNRYKALRRDSQDSQKQYLEETRETIESLGAFPCIMAWVPFNEGWGQFDSEAVTEFIRALDGSRLIDSASGWFDRGCGDFDSIHNYFFKLNIEAEDDRIIALTEYGGTTLLLKEHFFGRKKYGYGKCRDTAELSAKYRDDFQSDVLDNIPKGLCMSIYTQLSDIEDEINGIYTYDREVLKFDEDMLKELNGRINEMNAAWKSGAAGGQDAVDASSAETDGVDSADGQDVADVSGTETDASGKQDAANASGAEVDASDAEAGAVDAADERGAVDVSDDETDAAGRQDAVDASDSETDAVGAAGGQDVADVSDTKTDAAGAADGELEAGRSE